MSQSIHQSILTQEIIELLAVRPNGTYLDATFGGGGHSRALLAASSPNGIVYALDLDPETSEFAEVLKQEFPQRFHFEASSYITMMELGEEFDGILFDLGLSSDQLESRGRGLSFQKADEPLDLRFNARYGQTAAQFLNQASLPKIELVFREFAEDRYWRKLARNIVEKRRSKPIRTVGDFITLVGTDQPKVLAPLFQALRINVNDELGQLKDGLIAAKQILKPTGRIAVLSFHSLEDRMVKEFFRAEGLEPVTKRPIVPTEEEIRSNPRSRSAKLRVAAKQADE